MEKTPCIENKKGKEAVIRLNILGIKLPEKVAELHLLSVNFLWWEKKKKIGWLIITSGNFHLVIP